MASQLKNKPWFLALLALLPGIIGLFVFVSIYQPLTSSYEDAIRAQAITSKQAQILDTNIQQLSNQLANFSRLPELRRALLDNNAEALASLSTELSQQVSHADRLLIIPLNTLSTFNLGPYEKQLKNNIEKDMVSKAKGGEVSPPDVYKLNGEVFLALASPVFTPSKTAGVILLTVKSDWLDVLFEHYDSAGQLSRPFSFYYQQDNFPPNFFFGQATKNDAVTIKLRSNPQLYIQLDLQHLDRVAANPSTLLMYIALGLCAIASLIPLWLLYKLREKTLSADINTLKQFITQSNQVENEQVPTFQLRHFVDVVNVFNNKISKLAASKNTKTPLTLPDQAKDSAWLNPKVASNMQVEETLAETDCTEEPSSIELPPHIFRAYDIRGHADRDFSDDVVLHIGKAIASLVLDSGQTSIVIGRDGRSSSGRLHSFLSQGILESGCDIIDIDIVATPVLYFAAQMIGQNCGVMITGSHNPPEDNGFKIMHNGTTLATEQVQEIATRVRQQDYRQGNGTRTTHDIIDQYIDQICEDVVVATPLKIVVDCGNGAASEIAPMLYAALGCETIPLFAELDGQFPNRSPDPSIEENLSALKDAVQTNNAHLGLAFDGDADRLVVVTQFGDMVTADQLLMIFAKDIITRNPGADIVFDVKCSRHLNQLIAGYGGRPVMYKSGHSLIKQKMLELNALLGGEYSGHFCFKERWYGFDDGLYAGARLIEILSLENTTLQEALEEFPNSKTTNEIRLEVGEEEKFALIEQLKQVAAFQDGNIIDIDGLRVDYPEGWGLIRASNTAPELTLRFEADSDDSMAVIQSTFQSALSEIDPTLAANLATQCG